MTVQPSVSEVTEAVVRYAELLDGQDFSGMRVLLHHEIILERPGRTVVGADHVVEELATAVAERGARSSAHVVRILDITERPDGTQANSVFAATHHYADHSSVTLGRYIDLLTTVDGRTVLIHKTIHVDAVATTSEAPMAVCRDRPHPQEGP